MNPSAAAQPFPAPVFEGSEKRIEIDFAHAHDAVAAANGLRAVTRGSLDAMLDTAACCIVSARHGTEFDAYVLSESSLFIYPRKVRDSVRPACVHCCSLALQPTFFACPAYLSFVRPLHVRPDCS